MNRQHRADGDKECARTSLGHGLAKFRELLAGMLQSRSLSETHAQSSQRVEKCDARAHIPMDPHLDPPRRFSADADVKTCKDLRMGGTSPSRAI